MNGLGLTFKLFGEKLTQVFDLPDPAAEASHSLLSVTQGNRTITDYIRGSLIS